MTYRGKTTDQTVRIMSAVEAAWVGATIEGEGSIRLRGRISVGNWVVVGASTRHRLKDVDALTPMSVDVYSSDVETIATVLRLVGAGTVYYRPPRPDYVSPRGRQAFAKKDSWQWTLKFKDLISALCVQIRPYLTSKRDLATYALPAMEGGSCHPTHFEGPPAPNVSEEQVAKNWEEFRKSDKVDPRAIRRQHRFKPGHEPDYLEPESGWKYVDVQFEGEDADPDQRDMLKDSTPVAMDCERCGTQLNAVGRMSSWDVINQPGVSLVNRDSIDEARKKELQEEKIVILACPNCRKKYQWLEEFLPKGEYDVQE